MRTDDVVAVRHRLHELLQPGGSAGAMAVEVARAECRHACVDVLVATRLEAVEVGQPGPGLVQLPVLGVARALVDDARLEVRHDERARANWLLAPALLGALEVFLREDQVVGHPEDRRECDVGVLHLELHRAVVGRGHSLHRVQWHRPEAGVLVQVEGEGDVLGGHCPAVDRLQIVELDVLGQGEYPLGEVAIRLRGLRQVGYELLAVQVQRFQREQRRTGLDARPVEAVVERRVRGQRDHGQRVPVRRRGRAAGGAAAHLRRTGEPVDGAPVVLVDQGVGRVRLTPELGGRGARAAATTRGRRGGPATGPAGGGRVGFVVIAAAANQRGADASHREDRAALQEPAARELGANAGPFPLHLLPVSIGLGVVVGHATFPPLPGAPSGVRA